ncbi:MAG: hypothetical protein ABJG75_23650 [Roseobacter sp.]
MIFVHLGRLLAWALLILGTMRAASGFYVASIPDVAAWEAANRRYFGSGTSGEAIDKGLAYAAIGIVIGVLVHIASKKDV